MSINVRMFKFTEYVSLIPVRLKHVNSAPVPRAGLSLSPPPCLGAERSVEDTAKAPQDGKGQSLP